MGSKSEFLGCLYSELISSFMHTGIEQSNSNFRDNCHANTVDGYNLSI